MEGTSPVPGEVSDGDNSVVFGLSPRASRRSFRSTSSRSPKTSPRASAFRRRLSVATEVDNSEDVLEVIRDSTDTIDLTFFSFSAPSLETLAHELKRNAATHLILQSCYLGSERVGILAKCLPHANIRTLDLSFNYIGEAGVRELGEVLTRSVTLTCLSLWSNTLGDSGVRELARVLPFTRLTSLDLRSNGLKKFGLKYFAACLPATSLTCLILRNNNIGCIGAQYLADVLSLTKLEILVLQGCGINGPGLDVLATIRQQKLVADRKKKKKKGYGKDGLDNMNERRWLDTATRDDLPIAKLRSIDLSFNCFPEASIFNLSEALPKCVMVSLDLRNCDLNDKCGMLLARNLSSTPFLASLVLEGNRIRNIRPFIDHLPRSSLTDLNLSRNLITQSGAQMLIDNLLLLRPDPADDKKLKTQEEYLSFRNLERRPEDWDELSAPTCLRTLTLDDGRDGYPGPNPAVLEMPEIQQKIDQVLAH